MRPTVSCRRSCVKSIEKYHNSKPDGLLLATVINYASWGKSLRLKVIVNTLLSSSDRDVFSLGARPRCHRLKQGHRKRGSSQESQGKCKQRSQNGSNMTGNKQILQMTSTHLIFFPFFSPSPLCFQRTATFELIFNFMRSADVHSAGRCAWLSEVCPAARMAEPRKKKQCPMMIRDNPLVCQNLAESPAPATAPC